MKVHIRTKNPDARNLVEVNFEVESLRDAKGRFRAIQLALPHVDLVAHVARDRRAKRGTERHHTITRSNMY